jgi:glycosyltransferase involved in cell wall biosynthesis
VAAGIDVGLPERNGQIGQAQGPFLSVVIPARNSRHYLEELYERLDRLEEPTGGYEVIFVDDGSTDGSYEYLRDLILSNARFQVVRGPGRGPAAARNAGIAASRGRFVAFTDADVLPEADWLVRAGAVLGRGNVHALEGAVLPWSSAPPDGDLRNVRNEDGQRYMTANMVYERSVLESAGGFDETFRRPFLEDTDLAFRVMDLGIHIPFVPELRVRHRDMPFRPRQALLDQTKLHWLALVARKHPHRYRSQLRPKIQSLRPGDADLLLAILMLFFARRGNVVLKSLACTALAVAVRRVLAVAEVRRAPTGQRAVWFAVALVAPAVRFASLITGWVRFNRVAL